MSFLSKYKSLSPEAQNQLNINVALDPTFKEKVSGEIKKLSAADNQELKTLMTGRPIDLTKVPQGQTESKLENEVQKSEKGYVNEAAETLYDTAIGGLGQAGAFLSPIASAVNVGAQVLTGSTEPNMQDIKASFNEAEAFGDQARLDAQNRSPIGTTVGDIGGSVALSVATGSAVAKLAGKLFSAGKYVKALTAGAAFTGDTILGAAQIEAARPEGDVGGMLDSFKESVFYTGIGFGVGKAINKGMRYFGKAAPEIQKNMLIEVQTSRGSQKIFESVNEFVTNQARNVSKEARVDKSFYHKTLTSLEGFNDRILAGDMTGAQNVIDSSYKQSVVARTAISSNLDAAGVAVKKTDLMNIVSTNVDAIDNHLADPTNATSPKLKEKLLKMKKQILLLGEIPVDSIGVSGMDNMLEGLQDIAKIKIPSLNGENVLGEIRNLRNAVVTIASNSLDPALSETANAYKAVNKTNQVLNHASKITNKTYNTLTDITSQGIIKQTMEEAQKNLLGKGALITGATLLGMGPTTAALLTLHAAGKTAKGQILNAKLVGNIGKGFEKLADASEFFTTGSGRNTKTGSILLSNMGKSIISNDEPEELQKQIDIMYDTSKLMRSPMERNSKSFALKKEALLGILGGVAPEMRDILQDAMSKGDDIGPIMEQIANHPAAADIMLSGQGWDGRTYDPKVKGQIVNSIDLLPNTVGNGALKKKMKEDLMMSGIIPDFNSLPQRKPRGQ